MAMTCRVCGRPADPFRDSVQVVGMRVEVVCRACSGGASQPEAPAPAPAPPAGARAAASAPAGRPAPRPVAARSRRGEAIALSAVLVAGAVAIAIALAVKSRRGAARASAQKAPAAARAAKKGVAIRTMPADGEASDLEEPPPEGLQAVLDDKWTHPEPGPFRELPPNETTRFGAYRSREVYKHQYCGSGHCGCDLGNKVGLPIVAARDGEIEKVVFQPTEVEGKWILMSHPGGLRTYYMHLDDVDPELAVGKKVAAGTMIGTLGTTGIKRSEPHLHFMISFRGADGKELFVDPEPIVREARLVEIADLPAWAKSSR